MLDELSVQDGRYRKRQYAKVLRSHMTPQEQKLWDRLRSKQCLGFHFRRQSPIGIYVVDFLCFKRKLVIEIDGPIHNTMTQKKHDKERDACLQELGYTVLRFTNDEVDTDIDAIVVRIIGALRDVNLTPSRSPRAL